MRNCESETCEESREKMLGDMDAAAVALRLAERQTEEFGGWLRTMRQATGVPATDVARRMGVTKREVFRLEQMEVAERIQLGTLKKAAEGLDCKLVYGLVPRKGTFWDRATERAAELEAAREQREKMSEIRRKRRNYERRKPWMEKLGVREALLLGLRAAIQKEGFRVRTRKTTKGLDEKIGEMKFVVDLYSEAIKSED